MRFCVLLLMHMSFSPRLTMAVAQKKWRHTRLRCPVRSDPTFPGQDISGGAGDTKGQMRLAHVTGEGDYRLPLSVMRGQR